MASASKGERMASAAKAKARSAKLVEKTGPVYCCAIYFYHENERTGEECNPMININIQVPREDYIDDVLNSGGEAAQTIETELEDLLRDAHPSWTLGVDGLQDVYLMKKPRVIHLRIIGNKDYPANANKKARTNQAPNDKDDDEEEEEEDIESEMDECIVVTRLKGKSTPSRGASDDDEDDDYEEEDD